MFANLADVDSDTRPIPPMPPILAFPNLDYGLQNQRDFIIFIVIIRKQLGYA